MNYKQTKQFSEFQCIGNKCINNCCHSWDITWSRDGVEKLRSAPGISENLKNLAESVFETVGDDFNIRLRGNGICPFQLNDGLCIIQKELGEGYLHDACTIFPRRFFAAGNTVFCSCSLSCPAVFQSLLEEENSAVLLTSPNKPDIRGEVCSAADSLPGEVLKAHSEFKYQKALLEFFYELISDTHYSTEVNIVRGALAAEKLTETVASGGGKKIAGMISELRGALSEDDVIAVIESVQPEYEAKLRMLAVFTGSIFGSGLTDIFTDGSGKPDPEKITYAKKRMNSEFEDKPFRFRNIALNLLLELVVPFRFRSKTIYENYAEFAVTAAVIKMCIMAALMNDELSIDTDSSRRFEFHGRDRISGLCSAVLRTINQNRAAIKELSETFNSDKLTPRDIAMLIK